MYSLGLDCSCDISLKTERNHCLGPQKRPYYRSVTATDWICNFTFYPADMWGLVLDSFGVIGSRRVPSIGVVHMVGVLVLDVGNELELWGDSQE